MPNLQPYHLYLCSTLSSHLSESAIFASSSQHPQAWQAQNRWRGSQSYTINTIGMPRRKKKLTLAKRKSRATPEEGEIWEVRAILDERTNKRGIVEYLVDWVPDKTGKEYDPEWRPENDVGDQAIRGWEAQRNSRTQTTSNDIEQQPLVSSDFDSPTSAAAGNKRQREESVASSGSFSDRAKRRRKDTVVEIALPAKPDFDPSDYAAVPLTSQTTIPDSQEVQDSFPSAVATVGHQGTNLGLRSRSPSPSRTGQPSQTLPGGISLHDRYSSQPSISPPQHRQPDSNLINSEPSVSRLNTSEEQDGPGRLSFGERQVVTASNSQHSLTLPPEASGAQTTSGSEDPFASSRGFLTQPEFSLESHLLETNPPPATAGSRALVADSNGKSTDSNSQDTSGLNTQKSASGLSQSAQVVRPLSSVPEELRTPSQLETLPTQGDRVIPASSPGGVPQASFTNSGAAAAESRSVPSDAIVSDTPIRRAHSVPRASLGPRNRPTSQYIIDTRPAEEEGAASAVGEAAVVSIASCTVSVVAQQQANSEPAGGSSLANADQKIASAPLSSSNKPAPGMDNLSDIADGDLTEYLRGLHARTVGATQDTESSTLNRGQTDRLEEDSASATLRAPTNPEQLNATAIHDAATQSSSANSNQFGNPLGLDASSAAAMRMDEEPHHLPATIAPSQLEMFLTEPSFHNTLPPAAQPPFHKEDVEAETVLPGIESRQPSVERERESSSSSAARSIEGGPNEFLVTLPMLASTRSLYVETLRSNKSAIAKYGAFFTTESAGSPDEQLISEVDDIFRRLHDHCDLPQFASSIPPLATEAMMKHATGTNSKFSFVYEFLKELKDTNTRILVLSQPGVAADNLEAIYETAEFKYTELDRYMAVGGETEGLMVILGTTEMEVFDRPLHGVDAVILFDRAARHVWQNLSPGAIVLSLVVANSIEHIDLQLPDTLDDLERRSAMGFALAASQSVISDPDRMLEPNELAVLFADFIKDPTHELDWEPRPLPAHFLDYYSSSQAPESQGVAATTLPIGRKRLLDGDDGLSTPTKRARTARTSLAQTSYLMSDLLKDTLSSYTPRPGGSSQTVEVTIDQLEWMAAKISRLEDDLHSRNQIEERLREVIKRNESQIKSYQKTIETLQPKWMHAVSERGIYELETKASAERAAKLEEELEKARAEARALSEKLAAQTPADLEEAQTKRDSLEKKLKNTSNDLEYLRSRYQAASSSAAELAAENTDLKTQIKHLEHKSSDATIRLHEINNKNMVEDQRRLIEDMQAIISQREQQLDRAEKELRALKNGRRETRSSSVPRSPRLNVMSPRTRGGNGGGGNTSRGTSPAPFDGSSTPSSAVGPVPGMTFYQPPGSHPRFSHLRE